MSAHNFFQGSKQKLNKAFDRSNNHFPLKQNQNVRPPPRSSSFMIGGAPAKKAHITPPLPSVEESKTPDRPSTISKRALSNLYAPSFDSEQLLDDFLSRAASSSLNDALESFFKSYFSVNNVYVWQEVPNLQVLYCHSKKATISHSSGIVGYAFYSRSIIRTHEGKDHPSFISTIDEKLCPDNAPILLFPLYNYKNAISFIVHVVKHIGAPEFNSADQEFVEWFTRRFKSLSRWLNPLPNIDSLILGLMEFQKRNIFLKRFQNDFASYYHCRTCEIWAFNKITKRMKRYTDEEKEINMAMAGVVGDALIREQVLNVSLNRIYSSYNVDIDGKIDEAILAVPFINHKDEHMIYCIVLRGPEQSKIFTKDVEESLLRAAPMVILAFLNSEKYTKIDNEYQDGKIEREGLQALLDVVEVISSQLDTKKLPEIIMEKGRMLTNSDRCSLFLVNDSRDRLITYLHQGLSNSIDIPIDKGIAGKTVKEGQIFNIEDAYETDFFDPSTDLESGYRTKSVLSVPIFNNRGEITGVTEMVNKKDGKPFSHWDQRLIKIFNTFCGISLENAQLYNDSIEMSNQIKSFFDISYTMLQSENNQRVLSDIMQKAKNTIGADRASLYIVDEANNVLTTFISDCDKMPTTLPLTIGVCSECLKTKLGFFVNDAYHHPKFNRVVDNVTGYKTQSLLVIPILQSDGKAIGVVEMVNKNNGEFINKDLKTVEAFGAFASIALEKNRLKDLAHFGDCEIELNKWIGESERKGYQIPHNLQLNEEQIHQVSRLNCFAVDFKGINHFRELFYFFNLFKILEIYEITNEQFFRFVFTISGTYNPVPYHNWTHACDVTQYITYEIKTAHLENLYTSFELFGILTAAVCHDANHEGFNNIYNVKAETPFGILYKDQSVMEMHHITVSIPIITRDDINLFHKLDTDETKRMWNLFVSLILATDMAHHFELVKKAQEFLDEGSFDFEKPEARLLSMQLILKVGDISNVSRPFNLADKWCDILNQEFFRQGDLEKKSIGLTSPLNDRDHEDKPKSQIGFYNFICLPLYNTVARIFKELEVNVQSLQSNLETWKQIAAQNAPPAEKKD